MGGFSGGIGSGLKFVGADLALNAVIDTAEARQRKDVPSVVLPGHEEEWREMNAGNQAEEKKEEETVATVDPVSPTVKTTEPEVKEENVKTAAHTEEEEEKDEKPVQQQQESAPARSNTGGWQGVLSGLGLTGLSDIGRNAGYILAMLPDILLGMFTGKTKSLGIKDNLVPIASIMAGMFVKNPLLKMTLIGLGGANLINKAGHEQLEKLEGESLDQKQTRYRRYEDQEMDPRIRDVRLQGNTLIASIDNIPVTIALPDRVVDAYRQGALPIGTLANAVLERCDRMQELSQARDRFEEESMETGRALTQR